MSKKIKTPPTKTDFSKNVKYTKERCASGESPNCSGFVEQDNSTGICNACGEHYGTRL